MEYSKTYFLRYLAANKETRKASKKHWLSVFTREFTENADYSLSASILAVISVADNIIASKEQEVAK